MIRIDPLSLQGLDDLTKALEKAVVIAAKNSAQEFYNIVESNIRTGYVQPVKGTGIEWDPVSDSRMEELIEAGLVPHRGLVAETEKLIDSLELTEISNNGFNVSVSEWYALEHEYGNPFTNLPARPFFWPAVLHFKSEEIPKRMLDIEITRIVKEFDS